MTSFWKITLGVGCGILLALALLAGSCFACFGYGVVKVAEESREKEAAASKLTLLPGWEFRVKDYSREIVGVVRNESDRSFSGVVIEFELTDSEGRKVGTAMDLLNSTLDPGKEWRFRALVPEAAARQASLLRISGH